MTSIKVLAYFTVNTLAALKFLCRGHSHPWYQGCADSCFAITSCDDHFLREVTAYVTRRVEELPTASVAVTTNVLAPTARMADDPVARIKTVDEKIAAEFCCIFMGLSM